MPKSKKSDSEKAAKDKGQKKGKAGKEKKAEKKDKALKVDKAPKPKAGKKVAKPETKAAKVTFTTEDISLRAYFIAERRQAMGWPGNETSDWTEAERQLKAEAAKKAKS